MAPKAGAISPFMFPSYIISKARWKSRLTVRALIAREIPFRVVIEPQEWEQYAAVIDPALLLVLPFSNLGQGSIPARNWVWEHSIAEGHSRHWILDDNIAGFHRPVAKTMVQAPAAVFNAMEDFCERYENIALSGPQYSMLGIYGGPSQRCSGPFVANTRIYSCILIRNDLPFRWRGRYNEDTDLSLRVLKAGWVTILFNAFRCDKKATLTMSGGNTDELYQGDGRLKMAQSLENQHPDVVKIRRRFGRWQHVVNYRPFKKNKLILKSGAVIPDAPNEYGMKLVKTK